MDDTILIRAREGADELAMDRAHFEVVVGVESVEQDRDPLTRRAAGGAGVVDARDHARDGFAGQRLDDVGLGREVVAECPLRDVGRLADVVDLGRFDPALGEELFRGGEDARSKLLDAAVDAAGRMTGGGNSSRARLGG